MASFWQFRPTDGGPEPYTPLPAGTQTMDMAGTHFLMPGQSNLGQNLLLAMLEAASSTIA